MSVVVKDLNSSGARIEYYIRTALPDAVVLIEPSLRLRRNSKVVWQRDGAAGLKFLPGQ